MTAKRPVCKRCGSPVGPGGVVVRHAGTDPLQVSECGRCGAIIDIGGGTRW
ncbi:small CPxCG-related zinc finger protein [Haloferax gibbonsii]|uniref:Small CPxCG-related zinc finger protein n=1 Tax=Haloferax gibbonsii TaxID=35746 RepID=A0A871BE78_HALGI|nr:small CPxCG-related zinc finger protein [Haloferax gibbonsii]